MTKPVRLAFIFFVLLLVLTLTAVFYILPGISCRALSPTIDLKADIQDTFKPLVNFPWLNYGTDFGTVEAWSASGVHHSKRQLKRQFEKLKESGIRAVVWHLLADGRASPEFDARGNPTGFDPEFWNDYDDALTLAEASGTGIIWVLLDFNWFNPAAIANGATLGGHADVIIDKAKRKKFFKYILEPLLKRQRRNPYINGWILINEPENAIKEGYVDVEILKEFLAEAAAVIKRITCKQYTAVGSKDLPSALHYWSGLDLDAVIFHHYEHYFPPALPWLYAHYPQIKGRNVINGEFFINMPGEELQRYLYRMRALGFAGAWPWSVNAEDKEAFAALAARYASLVNSFRDKAEFHRSGASRQELSGMPLGWKDYLQQMQAGLARDLADYSRDLETQTAGMEINRNWLNEIEAHINREKQLLAESEAQLQEAAQGVEENRQWLNRTREVLFYYNKLRDEYVSELEVIRAYRGGVDKEWERETLSALREVEQSIEIESGKGNNATKALKSTRSWVEEVKQSIRSFRQKIELLEENKAAAHSALRRCEGLVEWDSFHIEFGKRVLSVSLNPPPIFVSREDTRRTAKK
jgi:hypothetical protein